MASANLIETFNMTLPPEGPGAIPITLEFDGSNNEQEIDLTEIVNLGTVSYISGVFVETFDGTNGALELEINSIGQRTRFPANSFSTFALPAPNPPKFKARALDGFEGIARLHFVNFPLWPYCSAVASEGGGGGSTTGPAITDYSIALAGVSEPLFNAGEAARYLFVYNPVGNGPVTLNLANGDADLAGIPIAAGGSYELNSGVSGAVTITGTATETVTAFGGA